MWGLKAVAQVTAIGKIGAPAPPAAKGRFRRASITPIADAAAGRFGLESPTYIELDWVAGHRSSSVMPQPNPP
jgi:hypothetical protein